jgi:hypothetical protein
MAERNETTRKAVSGAPHRSANVTTLRLYLLRALYLLLVLMLGSDVWPELLHPSAPIPALEGVAYSFWGALSVLGLLGVRYPLKMMPVVMAQFCYKLIWVLAVFLPLQSAGLPVSEGLKRAMIGGLLVDLVVIPWPYVMVHYLRAPGEPWRQR